MIARPDHLKRIAALVARNPVTAILGARQVGKTTLARQFADQYPEPVHRFDLESPADLARLSDPLLALGSLAGLIVVDEVQRRPELFPVLRVLADRPAPRVRFLLLGSASPDLLRQSSESPAGRIAYHELGGFGLDEVGSAELRRLWVRGGFPRSFLADSDTDSYEWRLAFIRTFLERDLTQLGIRIPSDTLRRFWSMVAHYHGQIWNGAELARAFGVAGTSVRRYLDTLTAALVVRQLRPWHENLAKRQVKAPKVFIVDPGLLHALLGLPAYDDLAGHPKVGASWEGYAAAEVVRALRARPEECYFWATHTGAELDLLVVRGRSRRGFEFKYSLAPARTRSMFVALEDLGLERIDVIYPGTEPFALGERIRAVPLAHVGTAIDPL